MLSVRSPSRTQKAERVFALTIGILCAFLIIRNSYAACFFDCDLSTPHEATWSEKPPKNSRSSVTFLVSASLDEVKSIVDRVVPSELYRIDKRESGPCIDLFLTKACADINLNGSVRKDGSVEVFGSGEIIEIVIPLRVQVRATGTGELGAHIQETANARMRLKLRAQIDIGPDWNPRIQLETSHQWSEPPNINVAGFRITFSDEVDREISRALRSVEQDLERSLAERLNIREEVKRFWDKSSEPMLLKGSPELWLRAQLDQAYFMGLRATDEEISMALGLSGEMVLGIGERLHPVDPLPLPPLTTPSSKDQMNLRIPISVPYTILAEEAERKFTKPMKTDNGGEVWFRDVTILPVGRTLGVAANVDIRWPDLEGVDLGWLTSWFGTRGILYIVGTPIMDDGVLKLENLTFTSKLDSTLASAAFWVFRQDILNALEDSLRYDFNKELSQLENRIAREVDGLSDSALHPTLEDVSIFIADIRISDKKFIVETSLTGRLSVEFSMSPEE